MRVQAINNTQYRPNFDAGIRIDAKENTHRKFLYNEVMDVVKEHHIPSVFRAYEITFNDATKEALKKLDKLNIKYTEIKAGK